MCPYRSLLLRYPDLVKPPKHDAPVKHDVEHFIRTRGPPQSCRYRRLAPERRRIAEKEFDKMLALGIIRPSSSSWSSPLHVVAKQTQGDWRPCGDFRALNTVTEHDNYPIPHIQDCVASLHGKKYLFNRRPHARLSPNSRRSRRHSENRHQDTVWVIRVQTNAFWFAERRLDLPALPRFHFLRVGFCIRICRRYFDRQHDTRGIPNTC